jgi:hypothetical protein
MLSSDFIHFIFYILCFNNLFTIKMMDKVLETSGSHSSGCVLLIMYPTIQRLNYIQSTYISIIHLVLMVPDYGLAWTLLIITSRIILSKKTVTKHSSKWQHKESGRQLPCSTVARVGRRHPAL